MGTKASTRKCKPSTIDYIRTKNVQKLTRQLSKRRISFRKSTRNENQSENNKRELKLDVTHDEQQRSALHFAAIDGDAAVIVALFEYMHNVDVLDNTGRTPLHYAAIAGNDETLLTLLLCHPNANIVSKVGTTAIHETIIHNCPRSLILLLQHGADSLISFQDYLPSLILAVYLNNKSVVEILLRTGIDPNTKEKRFGRSAFHYAAYFHDNTDIFQALLTSTIHQKIDINAQDNLGFSILDFARANVKGSTAICDLLLQLNVYDPYRGETSVDQIQIEIPQMQIFQALNQLSSLSQKEKNEIQSKKNKTKH